MTVLEFLLYLAAGRALTYLAMENGLLKKLWALHPLAEEFGRCDLCVGFWVYLGLGLLAWPDPFGLWWPPVEAVALAGLAAIGAHLLRLGWVVKFSITVVQ